MTDNNPQISKQRLTKATIESLKPATDKQYALWDSEVTGLHIKVSRNTKTFFVRKRVKGQQCSVKIGRFPTFSVDAARKRAREVLVEMQNGINPNHVRKQETLTSKSFGACFDDYIKHLNKHGRTSSINDYKRRLEVHLSDFRDMPASDITRDMVLKKHTALAKAYGKITADKTISILGTVLKRYSYENQDFSNPVTILTYQNEWFGSSPRERHIAVDELQAWYRAVSNEPNVSMRNFLIFLLFTGLRKNEARTLRWHDINFHKKIITIQKTKNGLVHQLPITPEINTILRQQKKDNKTEWVFHSKHKAKSHIVEPKRVISHVKKATDINASCHDLRRTFAKVACHLDIDESKLKKLLNHKKNDVTERHYSQTTVEYLRQPLATINEYMAQRMDFITKKYHDKS